MATSINVFVLFSAFAILGNSICANPMQTEGRCTGCGPLDILIGGNCYPKIRGCMNHTLGPICIECQFGYVLSNGKCIRVAVYYNLTNTTIPPVVISTSTLTFSQVKDFVGQQYTDYFVGAHKLFLRTHPELGIATLKSIDKLETQKGAFLVLAYETKSLKYQATALVDLDNKLKQFSFSNFSTQRKDPYTANNLLIQILNTSLVGYILFQVQLAGDNYIFDYINSNSNVIRIQFNRNDVGVTLRTKLTIKNLGAISLAKQQTNLRTLNFQSNSKLGI